MSKLKYLNNEEFKARLKDATDADSLDDVLLRKQHIPDIKLLDDKDRKLRFTISTEDVDRDGDTIKVRGWDVKNFRKNPVVLFGHNSREPSIAKATKVGKSDGALTAEAEFLPPDIADHDHVRFSDMVFQMLKQKFLRATSVGFRPLEFKRPDEEENRGPFGVDFIKQELLEFSVVPVPANPEALIQARSAGIDIMPYKGWAERVLDEWDEWQEDENSHLLLPRDAVEAAYDSARRAVKSRRTRERVFVDDLVFENAGTVLDEMDIDAELGKTVISFAAAHAGGTPAQAPDTAWNTGREVADADIDDLLIMSAWRATKPRDELTKADFKFPHHAASDDHPVNLRALRNGIAVLNGARGGADIPDGDRRGVFNHLARHMRQDFDEEPPELRLLDEQVLADVRSGYSYDYDTGELWKLNDGRTAFEYIGGGRKLDEGEQKQGFEIESIAGRKSQWTSRDAFRSWARRNGFKTSKLDETPNFWRYRQREPSDFERLRTICINPNDVPAGSDACKVQAVGGPLKAAEEIDKELVDEAIRKLQDDPVSLFNEPSDDGDTDVSSNDMDALVQASTTIHNLLDDDGLSKKEELRLRAAAELLDKTLQEDVEDDDDEGEHAEFTEDEIMTEVRGLLQDDSIVQTIQSTLDEQFRRMKGRVS